jgi:hypothetical protein
MSDANNKGFRHTRSGRVIYDTGKVSVGIRAGEQQTQRYMRGMSADAERLQAALVRYGAADGNAMHPRHWIKFKAERRIDKDIAANRERYEQAFDDADLARPLRAAPLRRAQVLYLNNGMTARLGRWLMRLFGWKE